MREGGGVGSQLSARRRRSARTKYEETAARRLMAKRKYSA